jgi:hypothetical protein
LYDKSSRRANRVHLSQPSSMEKLVVASGDYDLPAYEKFAKLPVWAEAEPPKFSLSS